MNDGTGILSGYAWNENAGWINFKPTQGGVTISNSGVLSGYAYSENLGWINFTVSQPVTTDWRPASVRGGGPTVPAAPTIGTAATTTPNQVIISFTPGSNGGSTVTLYFASSTPGNLTATSTIGSPITFTNLTNGIQYTFVVYAVNAIGTSTASAVSNTVRPTAAGLPNISTDAPSPSQTFATLNATILWSDGSPVTSRGFAYGTDPTMSTPIATTTETGSFTTLGTGITYTYGATGLTCASTYYTRAYGVNSIGTTTGSIVPFTTSACASAVTATSVASPGGGSAASQQSNLQAIYAYNHMVCPPSLCPTGSADNTGSSNSPVSVTSSSLNRTLTTGSTGSDVTILQKYLNTHGYTISSTGQGSAGHETSFFGSLTLTALKKLQCDKLEVCSGTPSTTGYGRLGPRTRAYIINHQ